MALALSVDAPIGVSATYHRITSLRTSYSSGLVTIQLESYLDHAARLAGKAPIAAAQVMAGLCADLGGASEATRSLAYAHLKVLPVWANATDC